MPRGGSEKIPTLGISQEPVRLWTIQEADFFRQLRAKGMLRTDGRRIEEPRFWLPYYRWMRDQMRVRGKGVGKRYPLWFYGGKPDMRKTWGAGGREVVRVEVAVPEERVLVSDYMLWHVPLNNGYLSATEAEDEAFDEEEERRLGTKFARYQMPPGKWMDPDSGYPTDLAERVLYSWERIFPDRWHEFVDPGWNGPCRCGDYNDRQAVVEELYPEDVVKVEPFVTRYGHWENRKKRDRG